MKRSTTVEIYAYVVCFVALFWGAFSLVNVAVGTVQMAVPGVFLDKDVAVGHVSNYEYRTWRGLHWRKGWEGRIAKQRKQNHDAQIAWVRDIGTRIVVSNAIALLICTVVFTTHWRLARRTRGESANGIGPLDADVGP